MSNTRKLVILAASLVGLTVIGSALSRTVLERPLVDSDHIIFEDTYRLSSSVDNALVVVADSVELNNDSYVPDDAALVARSSAIVNGRVDGDLTAMGSDLTLGKDGKVSGDASFMGTHVILDGQVDGDLTVVSDSLTIDPQAKIAGDITACVSRLTDKRAEVTKILPCSEGKGSAQFAALQSLRDGSVISDALKGGGISGGNFLFSLVASLSFTGLAALAVTLFPRRFGYLTEAVRATPRALAGVGCLTGFVMVGVGAGVVLVLAKLPAVGLLLLPVGLVLGVALFGMVVTGWIALALLLGDWLVRRLVRHTLPPLITVILGSAVLFIGWHVLALLPYGSVIGLVLMALLGSVGLGAAFATMMGTRAMRRSHFVQG